VSVFLILKPSIINNLGYKSLYAVKLIALSIVVMLLSKYIDDKINYYKSAALANKNALNEQ
jgi:hypothetical protein